MLLSSVFSRTAREASERLSEAYASASLARAALNVFAASPTSSSSDEAALKSAVAVADARANAAAAAAAAAEAGAGGLMSEDRVKGHITAALAGFIKSICLGESHSVANVLQDTLRLLTLWFAYGHDPQVHAAMEARVSEEYRAELLSVLAPLVWKLECARVFFLYIFIS